ncbi:MAG: hypothetical protein R3B09_34895 [Nannocystaceae bacterium]
MIGARRRRIERIEGVTLDAILIAAAVAVSEDAVQEWLMEHPPALFHGLALLHCVACPALLVAIFAGYGGTSEALERPGQGLLVWAMVLLFGASFLIPGVLGLLFRMPGWEFMTTIMAPVVVILPLWLWARVVAERRGWITPPKVGEPKPWWSVQALAVLAWGYLLWLETMLLVAAGREGPLVEVGLPLGVLIDYLPVRVVLYYVRESSRWERWTIALSVVHLLYRLVTA